MHTLSLSEFRAHASEMIDLVEKGETVRILRHGKPVAELVPARPGAGATAPSWKRAIQAVQYTSTPVPSGAALVMEERAGARR